MRGSSYEAMLPIQVSVNRKMKESTEDVIRKTKGTNLWKVKTTPVEGIRRDSLEEPRKKKWMTLSEPYDEESTTPFTRRINKFVFPKRIRMPSTVKTYDGTGAPEDHLKTFTTAAKVERWAMTTWCHMFNATLLGSARLWFDELPPKSIDSFKDLRNKFLAHYL
ncbi:hypothetical protein Tco_1139344 [Tanacetum coccineum]